MERIRYRRELKQNADGSQPEFVTFTENVRELAERKEIFARINYTVCSLPHTPYSLLLFEGGQMPAKRLISDERSWSWVE